MATTRYLAIINPAARSGEAAQIATEIKEKLSDLDITYIETSAPEEAIEIASTAADFDVVIAIGGDGTVNEIANGLMRIEEDKRPALAIIPVGSGNDTCRMIGSPTNVDEALEVLRRGNTAYFDLGRYNDSYFVNSFSIGLDALTVDKTTKIKEETGRTGMILYGQALLDIILNELKPTVLDVTADDQTQQREVLLHTVTNGKTYGGGFKINPFADPTDGTLTASRIEWMPAWRVLLCIPSLLRATHHKLAAYDTHEITDIHFASGDGKDLVAQVDGELLKGNSFAIEVHPHALRFVVCS